MVPSVLPDSLQPGVLRRREAAASMQERKGRLGAAAEQHRLARRSDSSMEEVQRRQRHARRREALQISGILINVTSNFSTSPRLNRTGGRKEICISHAQPLVTCDEFGSDESSFSGFMVRGRELTWLGQHI